MIFFNLLYFTPIFLCSAKSGRLARWIRVFVGLEEGRLGVCGGLEWLGRDE